MQFNGDNPWLQLVTFGEESVEKEGTKCGGTRRWGGCNSYYTINLYSFCSKLLQKTVRLCKIDMNTGDYLLVLYKDV